jgi:hypothetical protein
MRIMKWIVGLFVKPKVDTDTEYVDQEDYTGRTFTCVATFRMSDKVINPGIITDENGNKAYIMFKDTDGLKRLGNSNLYVEHHIFDL